VNLKCRMIHILLRNYQELRTKLTSDFAVSKPLGLRLGTYRELPSKTSYWVHEILQAISKSKFVLN
jgi:hypothetical protein